MPVILTMSMRKPISKTSLVFDLLAMITELYIYSMQFTLLETGVMMFYTFFISVKILNLQISIYLVEYFSRETFEGFNIFCLIKQSTIFYTSRLI